MTNQELQEARKTDTDLPMVPQPDYAPEQVAKITEAVRAADNDFESSGGSSRHWVRECLLPHLTAAGLRIVALALCLLPLAAFAQDAAPVAPAAPSLLAGVLAQLATPTNIAATVLALLGLVGGLLKLSDRRKEQVAIVTQHAFHGVEDLAKTTENTIDDKVAVGLRLADEWMVANGWRKLSEKEQAAVKLGFGAIHGATAKADAPVPPAA